ncbi:hypothetical protein HTG_14070 [Natrinema mahii]|nr:hypothetical protein HTG_14070 [Natrinema mahii]
MSFLRAHDTGPRPLEWRGQAVEADVIAGATPDGIAGEHVVDTERSRFELRPLVRERRNRLPFVRD